MALRLTPEQFKQVKEYQRRGWTILKSAKASNLAPTTIGRIRMAETFEQYRNRIRESMNNWRAKREAAKPEPHVFAREDYDFIKLCLARKDVSITGIEKVSGFSKTYIAMVRDTASWEAFVELRSKLGQKKTKIPSPDRLDLAEAAIGELQSRVATLEAEFAKSLIAQEAQA